MNKLLYAGFLAMACVLPLKASAQTNADAGLYDPAPPPGSAFVRFIRDQAGSGSEQAKLNGKVYDYLDFKDVSSYFAVPQGKIQAEVGAAKTDVDIESGKFYSVILDDAGKLQVNTDPQNENQAKSQIILYNLSPANDISLKTADGKVEIVPSLTQGKVAERQINPVKVPLAVYKDGKFLKDLGSYTLNRSQSYSVVVLDDSNIEVVKATTNTTR